MNAYTVVAYTYNAGLHCLACAEKNRGLDPEADDDRNADVYCEGLKRKGDAPYDDAEHACFDYENDSHPHGATCEDCGAEIYSAWCEGWEDCAPDLTVKVEDQDDDPWTAMATLQHADEEGAAKWISWQGRTIGGSSWEHAGDGFWYAMPHKYTGCVEAWRRIEGYARLDLSEFTEDPLEHFAGMSSDELDAEFTRLARGFGQEWRDENEAFLRAEIAEIAKRWP